MFSELTLLALPSHHVPSHISEPESRFPWHQNFGRQFGWCSGPKTKIQTHIGPRLKDELQTGCRRECGPNISDARRVTFTSRVLWRASPRRCEEPATACRWWKAELRVCSLCRSALITPQPAPTPPSPVRAFFAEASFAHSELFNANGRFLFPLCSTRHLMCHFD